MQEKHSKPKVRIYTLSDPITGEIRYIGKTQQRSTNRLNKHVKDAISGKRYYVSHWIRSLLVKGRAPLMRIVEIVSDDCDWRDAERRWIAEYRAKGARLTNLTDGGDGNSGWVMPAATRQLLAKLGREISDETRAKRRASLKGRIISEHQRAIISRCQRTRQHAPCTEVTKSKIAARNKGNSNALGAVRSAETRRQMSKSQLISRLAYSKALISDEAVREVRERYAYTGATIHEIAQEREVSPGTIYRLIRGESRLDAGGPICTGKHRNPQIKCRGKVYRQRRKNTAPMFCPASSLPVSG